MKVEPSYRKCIGNEPVDKIVLKKCDDVCERVKDSFGKPKIHDYPSAIVGCTSTKDRYLYIETSYSPFPDYIQTKELFNRLEGIGKIGIIRMECKNRIGSCAEPKAAFTTILATNSSLRLLRFSTAFRPRTKQRIPYCRNCKETFGL